MYTQAFEQIVLLEVELKHGSSTVTNVKHLLYRRCMLINHKYETPSNNVYLSGVSNKRHKFRKEVGEREAESGQD